jgi:hypothetical protein
LRREQHYGLPGVGYESLPICHVPFLRSGLAASCNAPLKSYPCIPRGWEWMQASPHAVLCLAGIDTAAGPQCAPTHLYLSTLTTRHSFPWGVYRDSHHWMV